MAKCSLVFVFGLLALSSTAAFAATPTPTATPTPAATATPAPNPVSTFVGSCWFYGRPCSGQTMTATVEGKVCATSSTGIAPPDTVNRVLFTLTVPSEDVVPACGKEGSKVDFFVGDLQTNQSAVWHAGASQTLAFIAGPPFALFGGTVDTGNVSSSFAIVAFVNGNACGYVSTLTVVQPAYEAVVFSNEQQRGCGTEGATVTFKLVDVHMNALAVASQTGAWHAWDGVAPVQQLNLTFSSVKIGNVGTGDGARQVGGPWAALAAALSVAGVIGITTAAALHKRQAD